VEYQPGEANFAAIQAWNAASVYQRALALWAVRLTEAGRVCAH
jgi:membrane-bound lytic murein transglycosylase B